MMFVYDDLASQSTLHCIAKSIVHKDFQQKHDPNSQVRKVDASQSSINTNEFVMKWKYTYKTNGMML